MPESAELQEAVQEFRQYLSDRIAPLMVADSMGLLLQYPAQALAAEIHAWASHQQTSSQGVPLADFLFHAVKKVALMGEFELVPKEVLGKYLADLGEAVLPHCPEVDRELLRQNLAGLGRARGEALEAPVEYVHRQAGAGAPAPAAGQPAGQALSQEVAQGLRRLSVFLEHLQPHAPADQRQEVASHFMSAAALQSSNEKELEEHLAPLRQLGIDTATDRVFRTIAQSLPGWGSLPAAAGAPPPPAGVQVNAMRQIVSLAEDPAEAAKRFRELVHAAVEQFNQGHLGRAVTMFELAEQLVSEQKVKPMFVESLRSSGHEYLDAERLKKLAERLDARPGLRTILGFFPALSPDGLLKALDGEPQRERRRELLALLEIHEGTARVKARDLLSASVAPGANVDPFFQMNLVYLLRIIPRPKDAVIEDEVNLVTRVAGKSSPPPLVKQIIAYLAQTKHDKAERSLITYLRVFENMLLQPETAVYPPQEIEVLLDRTCGALARYATPRAWRALVDHGLKAESRLGSTMSRLVEAGRQDLSASNDLVARLVAALKNELPRSLLGIKVKKNDEKIVWLIQALSGTPTPEVRAVLTEVADKHRGEKFAEAAAKALAALAALGKPPEPTPGISGDLELFGLPGLLQTLGQSSLTGVLGVMNAQGKTEATLLFEAGKFRGAQYGRLRGEEAVYQLFEKPFPGTFAFVSRHDIASQGSLSQPLEIVGFILEGVRRYDEWKQAAALVPDRVKLKPTGTQGSPIEDEQQDFVRALWAKASAGMTPIEMETSATADSYRVRRLLAHWVEEGALRAA